jgi:hypothetical protein
MERDSTAEPSESLEKQWHREMLEIIEAARAIGYNPSRFIQLLSERGALRTGHHLIDDYDDIRTSDGFRKLWELKRLDLAVEARALKPEYRPLFSPAQLATCRRRLEIHGWRQQPPWQSPPGGRFSVRRCV